MKGIRFERAVSDIVLPFGIRRALEKVIATSDLRGRVSCVREAGMQRGLRMFDKGAGSALFPKESEKVLFSRQRSQARKEKEEKRRNMAQDQSCRTPFSIYVAVCKRLFYFIIVCVREVKCSFSRPLFPYIWNT